MSALPELIQALLQPEVYPETTRKIKLVQTQMSFVFLTDDYVYKVKKPVNLGYLDYTSLEKRRFFCRKEIELNRRLCPDVYLGVVPIVKEKSGFLIGARGQAVEYTVKMLRLSQDGMMDGLLAGNRVSSEMVGRVAAKVAEFHRMAETSASISRFGDLNTVIHNTDENFTQTQKYIGNTISPSDYQSIKDYTNNFVAQNASLFHKRIADGRIRDCHGDLRAAHICFTDGICIYDCIEFNDRFRYCDVVGEVAFLAMDLDHYGRADLSQSFVGAYVKQSQDRELLTLLDFYKCYRAYVRGKVESFKLDDPHISDEEKTRVLAVARRYFKLAESYI